MTPWAPVSSAGRRGILSSSGLQESTGHAIGTLLVTSSRVGFARAMRQR